MKPDCQFAGLCGLILMVLNGITSAQAADPAELRIGFFPNVTHAQALYARATGYYDAKLGCPARWTAFNAGPTAIEAMFSGAIRAGILEPTFGMTNVDIDA